LLVPKSKNKNIQAALQAWHSPTLAGGAALVLATTFLSLTVSPVFAQVPPSQSNNEIAQEQKRQEERERVLRKQQERTPEVRLPKPEPPKGWNAYPAMKLTASTLKPSPWSATARINSSGPSKQQTTLRTT
jgi:hemolysin activation/secretion protein